ncbi:SDR family oxidoreductase [Eudoraea chungangensis]|uniref:SDR family oxidoreductase n=1 Tax=Eudoraea chungangensis TaxID=1481905 RepID=UPI0023EDD9EF|nr:SDR family oxidoreductase [Eudoraea chungangensis]
MRQKVVLITGGSSGIGKSIGLFLKSKGFTVYGTSRNPENYKSHTSFPLLKLEVRDRDAANTLIKELLKREDRIDVLINNAGIGITGPIEETSLEEMNKVFETNFYGPIRMIKAVLPSMRKQKEGLIINVTSIAGFMGLPYRAIYSTSKGALGILTEALRMECKDFGVKVTNVAPGDFATNIASGRYHAPVIKDSAYEQPYKKTLELIDDHVDEGEDPILVAKKIYRIINTRKPKVHYAVGNALQKFSLFLKNVLPDKVYERLLLKHYKL